MQFVRSFACWCNFTSRLYYSSRNDVYMYKLDIVEIFSAALITQNVFLHFAFDWNGFVCATRIVFGCFEIVNEVSQTLCSRITCTFQCFGVSFFLPFSSSSSSSSLSLCVWLSFVLAFHTRNYTILKQRKSFTSILLALSQSEWFAKIYGDHLYGCFLKWKCGDFPRKLSKMQSKTNGCLDTVSLWIHSLCSCFPLIHKTGK